MAKPEVKVGIMVAIGLTILAGLLLFLSGFRIERGYYELKVPFDFVGGLKPKAPVRLAGFDVGRVKGMELKPEGNIELTLLLKPGVKVRENDLVYISSLGPLGEKYVEIVPSPEEGRVLTSGEKLSKGRSPVRLDEIVMVAKDITTTLSEVVRSINEIVGQEETKEALRVSIQHAQSITENLEKLSSDLATMVSENKDEVKAIVGNLKRLSERLDELTESINGMVEEGSEDLKLMVKNFREISENLRDFTKEMEERGPSYWLMQRRKMKR